MLRRVLLAPLVTSVLLVGPCFAHHSFAMYDQTRTMTLTGTITDWQWTNPHTELYLFVQAVDGKAFATPAVWRIEGQSPTVMRDELKIRRDQFKPGDKVTIVIHPLRNGSPGGSFVSATISSGRTPAAPPRLRSP